MSSQPFKHTTATKIDFRKEMRPLRASERYFITTTFFFLLSQYTYIYIYFRKEKEKPTERRERVRYGRGEKKKRNEILCTLYMYVSLPPPKKKLYVRMATNLKNYYHRGALISQPRQGIGSGSTE